MVLCSLTCQAREEMPLPWLYRCACLHHTGQLIKKLACFSVKHHHPSCSRVTGLEKTSSPPMLHLQPNTYCFFFCRRSYSTHNSACTLELERMWFLQSFLLFPQNEMGSKVCSLLSVAIAALLSNMMSQLCQWNGAHLCVISVYTLHSLKCPICQALVAWLGTGYAR